MYSLLLIIFKKPVILTMNIYMIFVEILKNTVQFYPYKVCAKIILNRKIIFSQEEQVLEWYLCRSNINDYWLCCRVHTLRQHSDMQPFPQGNQDAWKMFLFSDWHAAVHLVRTFPTMIMFSVICSSHSILV